MSKYVFMVTSAINTKFGVYTTEQRLQQTIDTVNSIKTRAPGSDIYLLEMAGIPLTPTQIDTLTGHVNGLIDFTSDPSVVGLFNSTDNWDIVKNVTEVMCFAKALEKLGKDAKQLQDCQRIFKISGRYILNDDFDIAWYDQYRMQSQIVMSRSRNSQFPYQTTLVEKQYMSRLWSWPTPLTDEIIGVYTKGLKYMADRLSAGGYADIEHVLYKFLDPEKITEKDFVGISGNIAPNGIAIKD